MKNGLIAAIMIMIAGALLIGAASYRPKSRYVFAGIWVGIDPTNPETAIFYTHVTPDDVVGKRRFSYYMNHFDFDATLGGYFPDAAVLADGVGSGYATGKDTYDFSSIVCAVDSKGFVQYTAIGSGKAVWVNADEQMVEDFTWAVYLPTQDVDPHDGIPDEGQAPILCLRIPLHMKRVPHFAQCEPPPA